MTPTTTVTTTPRRTCRAWCVAHDDTTDDCTGAVVGRFQLAQVRGEILVLVVEGDDMFTAAEAAAIGQLAAADAA